MKSSPVTKLCFVWFIHERVWNSLRAYLPLTQIFKKHLTNRGAIIVQWTLHQFLGYSMDYGHQIMKFATFFSQIYSSRSRWRSRLRHCSTSRKIARSIPDGVIRIFHWLNLSGRSMALGSTQSLTETSTRNISWGVKTCIGLTALPLPCADCLEIWEPQPPGTLRACPGL